MDWQGAMGVLAEWSGQDVVVVAFLDPGLSLPPVRAPLRLEQPQPGVVRLALPGLRIALRRTTFLEAGWVPGHDGRGLSVVQGGTRVDVFLDD